MPLLVYSLDEVKTSLSELVDRAAAGEEIVIAKSGRPLARLGPLGSASRRKLGGWEGQVWMADDFDELPDDLLAAFEGSSR